VPKKEIKKLDIVVSDKIENIENFELTLKKETLEKIKEGEYLEVNVKVKGVGFTLNKEIIEKPTEDVTFTAKKIDMLEVDVPKGTEQLAVPVAREFTLEKNKEEIETLEKPVKLYFYLSDLGLENLKPEEIKDIYVHVYDEKEKVWKPVAGKYDPVEKVIMVYRLHMSKYSLLKSSQSYSDLENEEAKEIINDMLRSGISNESELFNPGNSVTREEFAAWISRTFSLDQKDLVLKFEDIDKSNPYYNEIANAFNQGLISGKSASLFDPKGEITREEMATLINRAVNNYYEVELIDYSVIDTEYTDVASTANWASDNVKKILNLNLMSLDSDKNFNSKTPVKKSEAAEILSKLQGYQ